MPRLHIQSCSLGSLLPRLRFIGPRAAQHKQNSGCHTRGGGRGRWRQSQHRNEVYRRTASLQGRWPQSPTPQGGSLHARGGRFTRLSAATGRKRQPEQLLRVGRPAAAAAASAARGRRNPAPPHRRAGQTGTTAHPPGPGLMAAVPLLLADKPAASSGQSGGSWEAEPGHDPAASRPLPHHGPTAQAIRPLLLVCQQRRRRSPLQLPRSPRLLALPRLLQRRRLRLERPSALGTRTPRAGRAAWAAAVPPPSPTHRVACRRGSSSRCGCRRGET